MMDRCRNSVPTRGIYKMAMVDIPKSENGKNVHKARSRWALMGVITLLCAAILGLSLWLYIPVFLENSILPRVLEKFALNNVRIDVQQVGWFSSGIGPICIGKDPATQVCIENMRVAYSVPEILGDWWHKRPITIQNISLSGVSVTALYNDSGFQLVSSEWAAVQALMKNESPASDSPPSAMPVDIRNVCLERAHLMMHYFDKVYWAQADISVSEPLDSIRLSGTLRAPRLTLDFTVSPGRSAKTYFVKFNTEADLTDFKSLIPREFSGNVLGQFKGNGQFAFAPFAKNKLPYLKVEGALSNLNLFLRKNRKPFLIMRYPEGEKITLSMKQSSRGLHLNVSPILTQYPAVTRSQLALDIDLTDTPLYYDVEGTFQSMISSPIPAIPNLAFDSPIALNTTLSGGIDLNGETKRDYSFKLHTSIPSPLQYGNTTLLFPDFFTANGEIHLGHSDSSLITMLSTIPAIQLRSPSFVGALNYIMLSARIPSDFSKLNADLDFGMRMDSPQKILFAPISDTTQPNGLSLSLPLKDGFTDSNPLRADFFFNGRLEHPDAQVKTASVHVPFQWPAAVDSDTSSTPGMFEFSNLTFQNKKYGSVNGTIRQDGLLYDIKGGCQPIDGLKLGIGLEAKLGAFPSPGGKTLFGAKLYVSHPKQSLPKKMDLGHFAPVLKGYTFDGTLDMTAYYPVSLPDETPYLTLFLDRGTLTTPDKLSLKGIHTRLRLEADEKNRWRTPSGQVLQIKRLNYDKFNLSDVDLTFRLEETGDFTIEGLNLKTCGGTISSLNTRLRMGDSEYRIMLYCDQLVMSQLFTQLNISDVAVMKDTVCISGLVPVIFADGKPRLGKGYLYTAPGQSGLFRMETNDAYMNALPVGSPGFVQLELSRLALKSFKYNWVKLDLGMTADALDSSKECYRLALSIMGRPSEPLPFTVNANGEFVKMEPGSQGRGFMQDMQLDLNFNADVELLDFLLKLNKTFENFKKKIAR